MVTNDGDADDADETRLRHRVLLAGAHRRACPTTTAASTWAARAWSTTSTPAAARWAPPITIAPVADTGFVDSKGADDRLLPQPALRRGHQQRAPLRHLGLRVAARPDRARRRRRWRPAPRTSNFKTQVHAAVFVVDLATDKELPAQGLLLTREFDKLYASAGTPDDASRRMPLIPNDIMFAAGTTFAYVTGYGSDAVFRIAYKADGTLERVGAASQPFINLKPGGDVAGGRAAGRHRQRQRRRGHAVLRAGHQREQPQPVGALLRHPDGGERGGRPPIRPRPAPRPRSTAGQKFFVTGLGRWSLDGQAWNSCEAATPTASPTTSPGSSRAARARPPRSTAATTRKNPASRRVLNWTGIFDEIHDFELNTRGNSGGVGAIVHRAGPPRARTAIASSSTARTPAGRAAGHRHPAGRAQRLDHLADAGGATAPHQRAARLGRDRRVREGRPRPARADQPGRRRRRRGQDACSRPTAAPRCHGSSQWTIAQRLLHAQRGQQQGRRACCGPPSTRLPGRCSRAALNPPARPTGHGAPALHRRQPGGQRPDQLRPARRGHLPATARSASPRRASP